jgi:orotidine-5'-phosphate decarboxylase
MKGGSVQRWFIPPSGSIGVEAPATSSKFMSMKSGSNALGAEAKGRLAFALDYPSVETALAGAEQMGPHVGCLKVGLELFVRGGPEMVRLAGRTGARVFLDLKLHDIAETVERAVASAATLGATYLTVHAAGGPAMLERASRRAESEGTGLRILAVTVLTSLDENDLSKIGVNRPPAQQALHLARLAKECGVHGLVCSAQEVREVRQAVGEGLVLCTPGIRPSGGDPGDQKRVATPGAAVRDGADLLVVGRPIRDAQNPLAVVESITAEMAAALEART